MAKQAKPRRGSTTDGDKPQLVALARQLAEIATEYDLSELSVSNPDATLTVRRGGTVAVQASPPVSQVSAVSQPVPASAAPEPKPSADEKTHVVTSPFVGTFYRKPNPDVPAYVSIGQRIEKGTVLCIVEAMKLMNEIEAEIAGTITGILAEDGSSVEYGQPLFKIAL